ncbi:type VI secretion system protein ImpA [Sphingomonas sp. PP-F2F-G114-C0414]|uniref:type VI secretion system protein TssA n=1 Tax=Sphingomonas sp. PP-F2F-G114-C0414 TaxID=2135662 RepID=UPI000EF9140E|nr:type VI secretion system protein TssA [Sphingomonas sp. PP-F2F-G114-C0414]RMB35578.1 type VI secretion system protein ImpA [Sphingomonas sp. PP-F2F-G114-C0414]
MTVEDLLEPVSADAPAGEDLSYDAERQRIEEAFEVASLAADVSEAVDWRETIALIEAQSRRTKDVWLAVYLARAGTRTGSLEIVETGCAMLAGLFDRYWDSVHPTLDEYGIQGRKGPCESLTRIAEFLGPLQRTVLLTHPRLGSYSGDDFARFARDGDAAEGYGLFRAALNDTPLDVLETVLGRLDQIEASLRQADAILTREAAAADETGTNFAPTFEVLSAIRRAVAPHAGVEVEAVADRMEEPASDIEAPPSKGTAVGRVDSREDVMRALDAISDYYQRREPSSPIPVALRRVRGWIGLDFMAIIKDIAPNSVADAGTVLLTRVEEDGATNW